MALEFTIQLNGNFAGALEKGNQKLGDTEEKAKKAEKAFEAFEMELGKVRAGAASFNFNAFQEGGHFFQFDLAEGAMIAFEAIKKVIEGIVDLGKEIVTTVGKTEDLNLALKLNVGEENVDAINELAESFKRTTRFDDDAIKAALLPLTEQGLTDVKLLDDMTTAAVDIATRRNQGIEGVQAALESFGKIALRGQVNWKMLSDLKVSQQEYLANLAELRGGTETPEELKKLMEAGKVDKEQLLSVALDELQKRFGGSIGGAGLEGATTLGASLERLKNLPENIFKMDVGGAGMAEAQKAIDKLVKTLDGPIGKKLIDAFDRMLAAVGKFINAHADEWFEKLSKVFDESGDSLEKIGPALSGFVSGIEAIMSVGSAYIDMSLAVNRGLSSMFGWLARAPGALYDAGASVVTYLGELAGRAYDAAASVGHRIWQGIKDGVSSGIDAVGNAIKGAGRSALEAVTPRWSVPQIPGAGIPVFAAGGIVDRPTLALVGESGPEAIVPLGGGASRSISEIATAGGSVPAGLPGGGVSISIGNITIQVQGAGKSGQEIGVEAGQAFRSELSRWLDEARAQVAA